MHSQAEPGNEGNLKLGFGRMKKKGFTFLEIIIVLAIMAILAGVAVPVAYRQIASSRQQATREEMINLERSLIGDTRKVENGMRSDFGYLGDWGGLADSLDALAEPQSPRWYYNERKKAGAGWNGPYISETFSNGKENYRLDAWHNPYIYSNRNYINRDGELVDAKIVSMGPDDRQGGGDDLTIEILWRETHSKVLGCVKDKKGKYLPNILVTIYFPRDGRLIGLTHKTDINGYFEFKDIPLGIRSISVNGESPQTICVESHTMQLPDIYLKK